MVGVRVPVQRTSLHSSMAGLQRGHSLLLFMGASRGGIPLRAAGFNTPSKCQASEARKESTHSLACLAILRNTAIPVESRQNDGRSGSGNGAWQLTRDRDCYGL